MCEAQHTALTPAALQTGFTLSVNGRLSLATARAQHFNTKALHPTKSKRTRKEINSTIKEPKILTCKPNLNL